MFEDIEDAKTVIYRDHDHVFVIVTNPRTFYLRGTLTSTLTLTLNLHSIPFFTLSPFPVTLALWPQP